MMWRFLNIAAIIVAVGVGVAVMQIKFAVKERRANVERLADQIRDEEGAIRVLEAEWALLSSPRLLQDRSYKYLALMPLRPEQIIPTPALIPMRPEGGLAEKADSILLPQRDTGRRKNTGGQTRSEGGAL